MANPRAFISFDFDHNERDRKYFVGQIYNSRTPFNVEDWSSKQELSQSQWEKILEEKVKKCHLMIVLVGRHMASANGVNKEIQMAIRNSVPIFGVYVDEANTLSTLPVDLSRARVVAWNWASIASMIDQCMKEGKNKIN
jgi:predicted nucleotide-binding protein (sugar kinase/HSP70/actin superfamily)